MLKRRLLHVISPLFPSFFYDIIKRKTAEGRFALLFTIEKHGGEAKFFSNTLDSAQSLSFTIMI